MGRQPIHGRVRDAIRRADDLTPEDAHTLQAIASFADRTGKAFGRGALHETLKVTSLSTTTRRVQRLVAKGYVRMHQERGRGRFSFTVFTLTEKALGSDRDASTPHGRESDRDAPTQHGEEADRDATVLHPRTHRVAPTHATVLHNDAPLRAREKNLSKEEEEDSGSEEDAPDQQLTDQERQAFEEASKAFERRIGRPIAACQDDNNDELGGGGSLPPATSDSGGGSR